MSRAFVKESDDQATELPERPQSPYPVMVTPRGLQKLRAHETELEEQKRAITAEEDLLDKEQLLVVDRDLRYVQDRIAKAVVVDLAAQPRDRVDFGAIVDTVDANDQRGHFQIVGEDEADPNAGLVSWVSPLGLALKDARVGDNVIWKRPIGDLELEVVGIRYPTE
ncbi:transcription elongation GreA/GreB family factor [Dongia mobilis]|uniref:Transcription elongation GreA/GreB family factor n=1 Tax=Dongia mobilis TaxID=578943 RepID=A0A4V3DF96_9PROT|nr:GreA/GreB family elongation factor [Dongia mobilis]TDQ84621.1 transcription elongation GreA/GreB family factor [Dongia mobilis]